MIPLSRIYSVPSVILNFFCPLISKLPFGKTLTIVADKVPLKLFDWLVAIDPANEFVFATVPPNPAKFLKIPVPPISAPMLSAFAEEFVTALFDENLCKVSHFNLDQYTHLGSIKEYLEFKYWENYFNNEN